MGGSDDHDVELQNTKAALLSLQRAKSSLSDALAALEGAGRWEISRAYYKTSRLLSSHIHILRLIIEKEGNSNAD